MKRKEIRNRMEQIIPEVPGVFHQAMEDTLGLICRQETAQRRENGMNIHIKRFRKRTLILVMAAILVIATAGIAAGLHFGLFETLLGTGRNNGEAFIQRDLAKVSFNECDVEVKEAAYDGISLYLVYSIRERAATAPVGVYNEAAKRWIADESSLPAMERDNIGWWVDHIWIDGKSIDMPSMSSAEVTGSDTPGELLFYQMYRLDQEGVYLEDMVEIALPIGERQSLDSLVIHKDPYSVELPQKGIVTFALDASSRKGIVTTHPNEEKDIPEMTAKVSEVTYSPINLYITLDYAVKPEALAAFIAQNGEGVYSEDGKLLWKYEGIEIAEAWTMGLELVDGSGKPLLYDGLLGYGGFQGGGKDRAWFMYPALETYPEAMFLAPMDGDTADMSLAVRVK